MSLFKLNRLKLQPVYYFSKIAPLGKLLKIKVKEGIYFLFRARTLDRTVLKEVWVNGSYDIDGFSIKEDDTVVDIGGHIGSFAIYAGIQATKGMVYSFEPFEENYNMLRSNLKLNNITNVAAENLAVGKEDGSFRFYIRPDKLEKGEIAYNSGGHSFHLIKNSDKFIEVPTLSFDSMIKKYNISKIDFLKMDCEGAEYDIIFNASSASLAKVSKIAMECHPFENHTKDEMVEFLTKNGFSCSHTQNTKHDLHQIHAVRKK